MLQKIIILFLTVICCILIFFLLKSKEKTGYISIQKLFNEFEYKKEMEVKLKRVGESRKRELDSMEMQLKILFKEIELNKKNETKKAIFYTNREEFVKKSKSYEVDMQEAVSKYDEIIIKQMNQYVKDFGEENNYKYIFGTDGKGSLMYADTLSDLTREMIIYINNKYSGKLK